MIIVFGMAIIMMLDIVQSVPKMNFQIFKVYVMDAVTISRERVAVQVDGYIGRMCAKHDDKRKSMYKGIV